MGILKKLRSIFLGSKKTEELQKGKSKTISKQEVNNPKESSETKIKKATINIKQKNDFSLDIVSELEKEFIVIDVETTGLSPLFDRIVEFGAIKYKNKKIIDEYNTLINPGVRIPKEVSKINNITNSMIRGEPKEDAVLEICDFIEQGLNGDIFLCAHNAEFDIDFLSKLLERNELNSKIKYVDTLQESRRLVKDLKNYKLGTVANNFHIKNKNSNRAMGDAKTCGEILINLIEIFKVEEKQKNEKLFKNNPSCEELEICAYIYKLLEKNGKPLKFLRFFKDGSKYIRASYYSTMFKFKFSKKGNYILVPLKYSGNITLPKEKATMSEGGNKYYRIFFNSYSELSLLDDFIIDSYMEATDIIERNKFYFGKSFPRESLLEGYKFLEYEAEKFYEIGKKRKSLKEMNIKIDLKEDIDISEIIINPKNNRVPLSNIKNKKINLQGELEGVDAYLEGEKLRTSGEYFRAIDSFDYARYVGYAGYNLYWSYAMTYRKLKDYENEISILDEGISRASEMELDDDKISNLETRKQKAAELLLKFRKW